MPTVTYKGKSYSVRCIDPSHPEFIRGEKREVTTAWVDQWGHRLGDNFTIEGYEKPTETKDLGNDGIPDEGWSRKDILAWLAKYEIKPNGYATKSKLLELVATVMSPDGVAETDELIADSKEQEKGDE